MLLRNNTKSSDPTSLSSNFMKMWDCIACCFKSWKMMSNKILGWEASPRYCQARISIWWLRKLVPRNMESCMESLSNSRVRTRMRPTYSSSAAYFPMPCVSIPLEDLSRQSGQFLDLSIIWPLHSQRESDWPQLFSVSKNFCENQRFSLSLAPTMYKLEEMLTYMNMQDFA